MDGWMHRYVIKQVHIEHFYYNSVIKPMLQMKKPFKRLWKLLQVTQLVNCEGQDLNLS